jgi:hypothetical protein
MGTSCVILRSCSCRVSSRTDVVRRYCGSDDGGVSVAVDKCLLAVSNILLYATLCLSFS